MIWVRFHANLDDYRPINFPVKYPYWYTGSTSSHSIVVSYADDLQYIIDNWPEACHFQVEPAEEYIFTDRFPKPAWFELEDSKKEKL